MVVFCPVHSLYTVEAKHITIMYYLGVGVDGLKQEFPLSPKNGTYLYHEKSEVHGKKIVINEKEVALFCYKDTLYAVDEKCPHLGEYRYFLEYPSAVLK